MIAMVTCILLAGTYAAIVIPPLLTTVMDANTPDNGRGTN